MTWVIREKSQIDFSESGQSLFLLCPFSMCRITVAMWYVRLSVKLMVFIVIAAVVAVVVLVNDRRLRRVCLSFMRPDIERLCRVGLLRLADGPKERLLPNAAAVNTQKDDKTDANRTLRRLLARTLRLTVACLLWRAYNGNGNEAAAGALLRDPHFNVVTRSLTPACARLPCPRVPAASTADSRFFVQGTRGRMREAEREPDCVRSTELCSSLRL